MDKFDMKENNFMKIMDWVYNYRILGTVAPD